MWFRLALGLGMSVGEAREKIGHGEFVRWKAFYLVEPWGCEVEDLRSSIGPYVTASVNSRKGRKPKLEHFQRTPWKPRRV